MEQFKRLSPAEQSRLAEQLGVTLPQPSTDSMSETITQTQSVMPRMQQIKADQSMTEDNQTSSDKDEETEESEVLPYFGYDLFAGNPTTFEPVTDVPVSSDYLLGPGDSLKVNLYGKQSQFFELSIDQEGQSYIPELGPISLAGLTFSEAKEKIVKTIDQKMIGVKASVSMGQLRSIRVFVLGEAYLPGSYVVSALSTITNALVLSGGISELGSLRSIQLKRQGKLIQTLDLYDLLLKGDTRNDAQLKSGDVVFIPPVRSRVGIKGEVRRPAYYELKEGEALQDLISFAGGLLPSAYPMAASINRIQKQGDRTLINVDLTQAGNKATALQDGDILNLPKVLEKVRQVVTLAGHIERPQSFTWAQGLRISHLVPSADYLKAKPDLDYALIKRYHLPKRTLQIKAFSLAKALAAPGTEADPLLQDQDEVIFFSKLDADRKSEVKKIVQELRAQASIDQSSKEVSISGDVRFPGAYPLVESMSVADLITAAGGLTERAFQLYAELNRSEFNASQTLKQSRLNLDLSETKSLSTQLKSRDVLQIKTIPNWAETNTVTLTGEVRFPGTYSINKGDTLATVIQRAGGLTEYAYAPGAMFTRVALKEQQAEQLAEMQERLEADIAKAEVVAANQTSASAKPKEIGEAQKILSQLKTTKATGRLVIDLEKVINKKDDYVIALEDGDELIIPRKKNSVTIVGEVQLPISQVYESDLSYWDYIERSGGLTNKADEEKIYIIKANGGVLIPKTSNWFASNTQTLAPGDTIVVPLDAEKIDQVILWRDMSQIFYQIALGAAAVGSL
jgi:protein involved in polysaccharide export with SLBB domain